MRCGTRIEIRESSSDGEGVGSPLLRRKVQVIEGSKKEGAKKTSNGIDRRSRLLILIDRSGQRRRDTKHLMTIGEPIDEWQWHLEGHNALCQAELTIGPVSPTSHPLVGGVCCRPMESISVCL